MQEDWSFIMCFSAMAKLTYFLVLCSGLYLIVFILYLCHRSSTTLITDSLVFTWYMIDYVPSCNIICTCIIRTQIYEQC